VDTGGETAKYPGPTIARFKDPPLSTTPPCASFNLVLNILDPCPVAVLDTENGVAVEYISEKLTSLFLKAVEPAFAILLETTDNSCIAVAIPDLINPNIYISLGFLRSISKDHAKN
jgi:hypothetical protein